MKNKIKSLIFDIGGILIINDFRELKFILTKYGN